MTGEQQQQQPDPNDSNNNNKAPRLPRWTRQEILVLIQGKRVAETRVGRGRVLGHGQAQEPKWATVSGYCKRHGVNRGPVQCRKRWSNLAGDYKKIKDWEDSSSSSLNGPTESESFWAMRNDLRRARRLPGFFDKDVYDILDNRAGTQEDPAAVGLVLALGQCSPTTDGDDVATAEKEEEEGEAVFFDSGRTAAPEEGIFSDSDEETPCGKERVPPATDIPAPVPISEQQYQPFTKCTSSKGTSFGKEDGINPEVGDMSREERKRKRPSSVDGHDNETNVLQHQLISVLEKNGEMLNAQLQSQNTNSQLDREQRKDHVNSLVAVISKLADALGRIADKL